jgi:2-polyprenyl-3-methyl-5-hydroxy-6-metoxy-1,4-benzoquinol methylase
MNFTSVVDEPAPGSAHYRQHIPVAGWIFCGADQPPVRRISAHFAGQELGSTRHLFPRADVARSRQLAPDLRTGFRFLAAFEHDGPYPPDCALEIRAEFADGTAAALATVTVRLIDDDRTGAPYGNLCNPQKTALLERKHLYSTGNQSEAPDPDCVNLLADYLAPGATVLDVGCGIGAYCEALRARGHAWTGCETSPACLQELARRQRPHRRIRPRFWPWPTYRLPAATGEFDAALAIEVLEHIARPDAFVAELARVARRQVFISVPNLEILPFLADRLVAPWHLLEGDHRGFFSRFNLRPLLQRHFRHVELLDYGSHPLASADGLPLAYHLFAVCDV